MAQRITVEAPNKVRYVLEAPDDITDGEIDAHVQRLMEEDAKHQAKTGFGPSFTTGLESGLSNLQYGAGIVAESTGFPEMAQSLKTKGEETAKKAQEASEKTTEEDVAAASKNGLIPEYLAKARKNIAEPACETIGRVLPGVAASASVNP